MLTPGQDLAGYLVTRLGQLCLFLVTGTSVLAVLLIFYFIIQQAWPFLAEHNILEIFTHSGWYPEREQAEFGVLPLIVGSLYVTTCAMLIAGPLGLITACFLSDIVAFRIRQVIKPVIELLAAIPSVAYGFFAVMVFAPFLQHEAGLRTGTNILNVSIILAIMALPTIISVAEDALMAVGRDMREASYALGATRSETIVRTAMPAAHNGILAGIVLGVMRAIGETMLVWMASGNAAQIPHPWWDIAQSVRTITATIAVEMGETEKGSDHFHMLFVLGLLLLLFTFVLNLITEFFLKRVKKQAGGMRL